MTRSTRPRRSSTEGTRSSSTPARSSAATEASTVRRVVKAIGGSMGDGSIVQHVECGLHSGFPPCCIAFGWIYSSLLASATVDMSYDEMDALRAPYHRLRGSRGLGYYACPACLLRGNIVTVVKCGCDDEYITHVQRSLEATATRKRKPAGWVSACLLRLEAVETPHPDPDAEDAIDRANAAWHRAVIARNRAP
jgi:hypothetical protein